MANNNKALERIEDTLQQLKNKDFNVYFFVVDSKNIPNGSMQYIYQIALALKKKSYNVKMVYQREEKEEEFKGVGEWLGEEYMTELEHINITKADWAISPSDFLFIPEALSSLMNETFKHKVPCKRFVVVHNYDYISELIPINDEWSTYGIGDAIVNTETNAKLLKDVFPYVKTEILKPCITEHFKKDAKPKDLIVNIISKRKQDVQKLIKRFYWMNPLYKFLTFRELEGLNKKDFSKHLRDAAITIWLDSDTPYGYSALEAINCGSIVIGKIPDNIPEWMTDGTNLFNNGIWTYDVNEIPKILGKVVSSWVKDEIPKSLYKEIELTRKETLKFQQFVENVNVMFEKFVENRIKEIEEVFHVIKNNNNDSE